MKIISPKITLLIIIPLCLKCLEVGFIKERNRARKSYAPPAKTTQKKAEIDTTMIDTVETTDTIPQALPIPEWKGKKFRLLEKTKMFQIHSVLHAINQIPPHFWRN